jgi:hypothetical protein
MNIPYGELILAGSFAVGDGYRAVNAELVNAVARQWAIAERGIDPVAEGSDQSMEVYPL